MQGQANYPRQAGYYEDTLKSISYELESIATNKHLNHKDMVRLLESLAKDIKEQIAKVNKECVY
jgi:hypothetical protein